MVDISAISKELPVLIAGPTASGKSALALKIAQSQGRVIVNADALQVFSNWRLLTARPSVQEELLAEHRLYGHIQGTTDYSVGQWLGDVAEIMRAYQNPVIVGGTGLYFGALTNGLADIPAPSDDIRKRAIARIEGGELRALVEELDLETRNRIDVANPRRVQRAWEVLQSTGRGIAAWQDETPPPMVAPNAYHGILLDVDRDWLADRINRRFDQMIDMGALDEARANLERWNPKDPSSKAIGAADLIAYLTGVKTRDQAIEDAKVATRQYAKRQRTWFRARMRDWNIKTFPD